jgi:uncharacterized membrane protein
MNRLLSIVIVLMILLPMPSPASADSEAVVQVVLFYSPSCGHCHQVIQNDLPPLYEMYNSHEGWYLVGEMPDEEAGELPAVVGMIGDVLQILFVNISTPLGRELYINAMTEYDIPEDRQVVPSLFIGETNLIGSGEIPEVFPGLIDAALEQGGITWPQIPGVEDEIEALVPFPSTGQTPEAPANLSAGEKFQLDPLGNSLSVIVLIGMIISIAYVGLNWRREEKSPAQSATGWIVPVLALLGLFVAGYLTFVESTGSEAACGPVGDCNAVQQSEYAFLFGVLPVGLLGMLSYIVILGAWLVGHWGSERMADFAQPAIFLIAFIGTLFSIYLTFLEPFVIGATCAWCLTSAVVITAIMLLSAKPARAASDRLRSH